MERELKLWRSEDYEQIKQLLDAIDTAQASKQDRGDTDTPTPNRIGDAEPDPVAAAVTAHNCFLDEAEPRMLRVRVKSLGPLKLQRLRADHQVAHEIRKERSFTEDDGREITETVFETVRDVDQEMFAFALVKACLIEPSFDDDDALDEWIQAHGTGTFAYLYGQLNQMHGDSGAVGDPKSWRVSAPTPTTAAT